MNDFANALAEMRRLKREVGNAAFDCFVVAMLAFHIADLHGQLGHSLPMWAFALPGVVLVGLSIKNIWLWFRIRKFIREVTS